MAFDERQQFDNFDFDAAAQEFSRPKAVHRLQELTSPLLLGEPINRHWLAEYIFDDATVSTSSSENGLFDGQNLVSSPDSTSKSSLSVQVRGETIFSTGTNVGLTVNAMGAATMWSAVPGKDTKRSLNADNLVGPMLDTVHEIITGNTRDSSIKKSLPLEAKTLAKSVLALRDYVPAHPIQTKEIARAVTTIARVAPAFAVVQNVLKFGDYTTADYMKITRNIESDADSSAVVEELTYRQGDMMHLLDLVADGSERYAVIPHALVDPNIKRRPSLDAPRATPSQLAMFARLLLNAHS